MKRCATCGRMVKEFAEFPCPDCGNKIVRCGHCREVKSQYACECGFRGP